MTKFWRVIVDAIDLYLAEEGPPNRFVRRYVFAAWCFAPALLLVFISWLVGRQTPPGQLIWMLAPIAPFVAAFAYFRRSTIVRERIEEQGNPLEKINPM